MSTIRALAQAAKAASHALAALPGPARSALLRDLASALRDPPIVATLLAANAEDLAAAAHAHARGELDTARYKRLGLDPNKLAGVAHALDHLADAPDLLGRPDLRRELDAGLVLERVPCPLGVLGVVFEARRRRPADRRPRPQERQRGRAQGRPRGPAQQPRPGRPDPPRARPPRSRPGDTLFPESIPLARWTLISDVRKTFVERKSGREVECRFLQYAPPHPRPLPAGGGSEQALE